MFHEILKIVNDDPELNSENIIKKIDSAFITKRCKLYRKWEDEGDDEIRREHSSLEGHHGPWRKSGLSLDHKFQEGTLIHIAIEYNYLNIMKCLKDRGANIDMQNLDGYNPLHEAVMHGHIERVQFLLENDADINAKTDDTRKEQTSLCLAISQACCIYHECNTAEDHQKYIKKYVEIIKFLIAKGADVNATNPLDCAVGGYRDKNGNINIVKLLVENGATITKYHLHSAVRGNNTDIAEFLIDNGADVNGVNWKKDTPLHICSKINTVQLLIKKGANINARNESGETPLYEAICHNRVEIAEVLIDNGADVNAKNSQGGTPLHEAVQHSNPNVIEFLFKKGAKANAKDYDGCTPLHFAALKNRDDVCISILVKNGADSFIRDNNYKTPIDYSLEQQQLFRSFLKVGPKFTRTYGVFTGDSDESAVWTDHVFLIKLQQAYNKDLIVRYSTMLLGAVVACTLFTTGNVTSDVPHIVGAVAVVTAAAYAMGRITYEIFKPSTTMEEVEQEPPAGQYQSLR